MHLDRSQAIGVFDSGVGGLTVAHAITSILPEEKIIYFGDTAHLPYGDKSEDNIRYYSTKITEFLIDQNCKAIVIACNTASAFAYELLADKYRNQLSIFNVIDPVVQGVLSKDNDRIGIVGTKGTINSGIYEDKIKQKDNSKIVCSLATPLFVPVIEEGFDGTSISAETIKAYLGKEELSNIDALILACTHYPILKEEIKSYYNNRLSIYDSTDFIGNEIEAKLNSLNLLAEKRTEDHLFYVSDHTEAFEKIARKFYGEHVKLKLSDLWKNI